MIDSRDDDYDAQAELFKRLRDRIEGFLEKFGTSFSFYDRGDYSVYEDYWGHPQLKVTVNNLEMLSPTIVTGLQQELAAFPDWEIVVAVAVHGHCDDWPDMGLTIRLHEIIDGLQRQYFPPAFRGLAYEGSRPGTERD